MRTWSELASFTVSQKKKKKPVTGLLVVLMEEFSFNYIKMQSLILIRHISSHMLGAVVMATCIGEYQGGASEGTLSRGVYVSV